MGKNRQRHQHRRGGSNSSSGNNTTTNPTSTSSSSSTTPASASSGNKPAAAAEGTSSNPTLSVSITTNTTNTNTVNESSVTTGAKNSIPSITATASPTTTKSKSSKTIPTILPTTTTTSSTSPSTTTSTTPQSFFEWCYNERQGLYWVLGCALLGSLIGFGFGTGHLTGSAGQPSPWRTNLSLRIKNTFMYEVLSFRRALGEFVQKEEEGEGSAAGMMVGVMFKVLGTLWEICMYCLWVLLSFFSGGLLSSGEGHYPTMMRSSSSSNNPLLSTLSTHLSTFTTNKNAHNPYSNPRAFYVLRESITREENGYVHPDLGFLIPAPCGANRGLGMVSDSYGECQTKCFPNEQLRQKNIQKKKKYGKDPKKDFLGKAYNELHNHTSLRSSLNNQTMHTPRLYPPEDILLRIPLNIQLTRNIALLTLASTIPLDVQRRAPLEDLDDAILLALLLTHERGKGRESRWLAYIATLPPEPSCGYASSASLNSASNGFFQSNNAPNNNPTINNDGSMSNDGMHHHSPSSSTNVHATPTDVWDTISLLSLTMGLDVNGWPAEVTKAGDYADRIANSLARDYGPYIMVPRGMNVVYAISWSLCMVSSRAVAASEKHGRLRLVPMMDMINHHDSGGMFFELTGEERIKKGDIIDTTEDDSGTFIITSMRHGRKKPLRKGQELLANYNIPGYSPLDWFLNLGFVPPERSSSWTKIDAALPRVQRDHNKVMTSIGGNNEGGGLKGAGVGHGKVQVTTAHSSQVL